MDRQTIHGRSTTGRLVGHHAAERTPEHLRGGTIVEGAMLRVAVHPLAAELCPLDLVPVERPRDVDLLATDHGDALPIQELLCKDRGQATEEVATAVHDCLLGEH